MYGHIIKSYAVLIGIDLVAVGILGFSVAVAYLGRSNSSLVPAR